MEGQKIDNLKGFTDKELFIELKKRIEERYKMNLTGLVFDGNKHYKFMLECPLGKEPELKNEGEIDLGDKESF